MSNHKVGDLVLRYCLAIPILGMLKKVDTTKIYLYEIEWINPIDGSDVSWYDDQEMREGRKRLNVYTQGR